MAASGVDDDYDSSSIIVHEKWKVSAPPSIFGPKFRMHGFCLMVKDLEASAAWYDKMLDFKEYSRLDNPKTVMMRNGHCYIQLMDGSKASSQVTSEGLGSGIRGYFHTAFNVPDAEKALATLIERGWTGVSHGNTGLHLFGGPNGLAPTKHLTFFKDPDGNAFQFNSGIADPGRATQRGRDEPAVVTLRGWS